MVEKKVTIQGDSGIHARPATMLVKTASEYDCEVTLIKEGAEANLKSIMNILALGLAGGLEVTIRADGEGESEAVDRIVTMIANDFKE
jgi:phosphocarrier protein HPr